MYIILLDDANSNKCYNAVYIIRLLYNLQLYFYDFKSLLHFFKTADNPYVLSIFKKITELKAWS